jgi:hypothetical protein
VGDKQETKPHSAKEPQLTKSARGGQEPFYADQLRSSYARGLAHRHGAPQQDVNKGLHPHALVFYLSREGEQGVPYSSSTIHVVPPLACIGLGNVERKHGLVCL